MKTPYEQIGQQKLYEVIERFYEYVAADDRINHLFPGDFKETARKQKQFLTQFLGGPSFYTEEHGHPMLRMRHMPFQIGEAEKSAWLENMNQAVNDCNVEQEIKSFLMSRLTLTAEHMKNVE